MLKQAALAIVNFNHFLSVLREKEMLLSALKSRVNKWADFLHLGFTNDWYKLHLVEGLRQGFGEGFAKADVLVLALRIKGFNQVRSIWLWLSLIY